MNSAVQFHCKKFRCLSCRLIWFLTIQLVTPMNLTSLGVMGTGLGSAMGMAASNLQCEICRFIPGLSPSQVELCCDLPIAIIMLSETQQVMNKECQWQFRKQLWNCSELTMPMFKEPDLPETPEKAFVYALASATVVHRITMACSHGELGSECSCDTTRNGLISPQGWQWGSCSDNVSYGISFAQNFLDEREIRTDSTNETAIRNGLVHLFNNYAGREVVKDNMKLTCRCHGISGSCTAKTCWREMPTYHQIGDTVKEKYDNAVKVHVSNNRLKYIDENNRKRSPTRNHLVYVEKPQDYCSEKQNFTQGRQCMPEALLATSRQRNSVESASMQDNFPPCENFCCSGSYQATNVTVTELCNCYFRWCCDVICDKCNVTMTKYHCTG